jgi:hypothetical protein
MMIYRLAPTDLNHDAWERSKVTKQGVRVLARDCADARFRAFSATAVFEFKPVMNPYAKSALQTSPWQLPDVTSCETDASGQLPPPDVVVSDDGNHWPLIHDTNFP